MGIVLRQGSVLPTLLFIVNMNFIDSNSEVDEGITVRSCFTNR